MIIDLFAGPGGADEGLRLIGHTDILGIEWDRSACDTALAAGHARLWADVAALDPATVAEAYGQPEGLWASPPCQAWSMAGKRKGEHDRANCHALADRMAAGDDSTDWTTWEDERSPLVCQPIRWVRELRPEWIALEEVPAVASLWEHFARIFHSWGYSVWTGDLNAADYGVPQTRTRRILIASRVRDVQPPEPTHAQHPHGGDLFGGGGQLPWVSMAEALGWTDGLEVNTRGDRKTPGGNEFSADRPSWALTEKTRSWRINTGNNSSIGGGKTKPYERDIDEPSPTLTGNVNRWFVSATKRSADQPAPTILSSMDNGDTRWVHERPATTVQGDPRIGRPGHKDRDKGESQFDHGSIRVTVQEAGILQSFRPDYPWQGTRTKQFQQVGNAVPPLLAAHVGAAVTGVALTPAVAA
jgi:DNA (cytosine-5)-methyltransferase 1